MKKKMLLILSALLFSCNQGSVFSEEIISSSMEDIISSNEIISVSSSEESNYLSSEENSFLSSEELSISEDNFISDIDNYIQYMMDETEGFIPSWSKEGFKGKWNYIDGVMLTSLLNMYDVTGNHKYKDFVIDYVNYYINKDGKFMNLYDNSTTGYKDSELDTICESRILYKLYDLTNDERYLKAINTTYKHIKSHPRNKEGNFYHKTSYPNQVWLDGLYMAMPFYSQYAMHNLDTKTKVNNEEILLLDDILLQYKNVRSNMFDEDKKLYYHGYDATKEIFWADKETGCSSSFWLRAMGWYMVSLIDVIEIIAEGELKSYLSSLLVESVEGIMLYQDESKMFYQVIDKGDQGINVPGKYYADETSRYVENYLETSGSSMIAYTLLKGSRLNVLDKKYHQEGKDIFIAIKDKYFEVNGNDYTLNSICITAGLGPEGNEKRDGSFAYYLSERRSSNDAKGVGPFIMAYSELIR